MMYAFRDDTNNPGYYEVVKIDSSGKVSPATVLIKRAELLDLSGLSTRDVRMVDPSLTDPLPPMLSVREKAILFNLSSLHGIATTGCIYMFAWKSEELEQFKSILIPRLSDASNIFLLEVIWAVFSSVIECTEKQLTDIDSNVTLLNAVSPNQLSDDYLKLLSKITRQLVEFVKIEEAVRQILISLLNNLFELHRMCRWERGVELSAEETMSIEIRLEKYLKDCFGCHLEIKRLLDISNDIKLTNDLNLRERKIRFTKVQLYLLMLTLSVMVSTIICMFLILALS